MIIDGHAHACGSYYDVEHIQNYMIAHKIDKVILCGGEPNSKKNYKYLSGYFDGITGEYATPEGYFVDEAEADLFDQYFLYKEKQKLQGQLF